MALPSSGSLSLKTAAGAGRSIAQEVNGNTTGDKSLATLSVAAGKSAPHSMTEFYNYAGCSGAPDAPLSVTASSSIPGTAQIEWTHSGLGQPVGSFRIEREDGGAWTFIDSVSSTADSYADNGAPSGTNRYRVRAENNCGNSAYTTSNFVDIS